MAQGTPLRKSSTRVDVARLAGLAPSTVSLVLNGHAEDVRLSAATERAVREAAKTLHYVPNASARALRRQRSKTIGLMFDRTQHRPYAPQQTNITMSVVDRARSIGHFVMLLPEMPESPAEMLAVMRDADVSGLVCDASGRSLVFGETMRARGMPVVFLRQQDRMGKAVRGPSIEIDSRKGVGQLADHLRERGYGSVGFIPGPGIPEFPRSPRYVTVRQRFPGPVRHVPSESWTPDGGLAAMRGFLAQRKLPRAIVCGNDLIAAGAIRACRAAGVAVPDDIAITGFGGFEIGAQLDPPLTTVDWPLDELGFAAVDTLVSALTTGREGRTTTTLHTSMIRRESA